MNKGKRLFGIKRGEIMKKKAFLYAYDKVNLGDDLFIRTIVNRYSHVHFYMWSDIRNKANFSDMKNLTVIDKNTIKFKLLSKIRPSLVVRYQENLKIKSEAIIYIGGSIFMEHPTWRNMAHWWKYQAEHHKLYVLGANFGPYHTEEYRQAMDTVFSKAQDVCLRDQYSYNLFKDNKKVRIAPDILFSYPVPVCTEKKRQIFISVINCHKRGEGVYVKYQHTYEAVIKKIISYYLGKDYKIKIASFCKDEGDEETAKNLEEHFMKEDIKCLNYDGTNTMEILSELSASEYIIATRFHAIVLGILSGQKVYPIIYSDKSKNMLSDIGFSGEILDIREIDKFTVAKMEEHFECYRGVDLSNIIELSEGHFNILDRVLKVG